MTDKICEWATEPRGGTGKFGRSKDPDTGNAHCAAQALKRAEIGRMPGASAPVHRLHLGSA